jgi:hypothetical protein
MVELFSGAQLSPIVIADLVCWTVCQFIYMPSPFFSSPLGLGDFNLLEMYLHH